MTKTADITTQPASSRVAPQKKVCLAANAADIDALRSSGGAAALGGVTLVPVDAGAPLPAAVLDDALALVIEVDPAQAEPLARISAIRAARPALPIVAALREADVGLVRTLLHQGIVDVVRLPFDTGELAAQIAEFGEIAAKAPPQPKLAPLWTIAGSTGGCGATTVITHLAAALAEQGGARPRVCVVDLDLQGGEVIHYVGREPLITVEPLLAAGERLDSELVRSATTDSGHGFSVIASPATITPLDQVDDDDLLRMLSVIRREYDYVLVDLPTDWTSWSLSIAASSTRLVLVTELSVAAIRQAKRRLQLFDSVGIDPARIDLVVNRVERKLFGSIGVNEVSDVLGHDVVATLSDEDSDMNAAQDEGMLITDRRRGARFGKDIAALARVLIS